MHFLSSPLEQKCGHLKYSYLSIINLSLSEAIEIPKVDIPFLIKSVCLGDEHFFANLISLSMLF